MQKLFISICLLLSSIAYSNSDKNEIEAKRVMHQVYESYVKLIPFIYTDKLITNSNDKKMLEELNAHLLDLQKAFKGAKHVELLKMPGFKPSLETIDHHISDTIDSVNAKSKVFAHARLKAMGALCVSCHTGISEKISKNAFGDAISSLKRSEFNSDFDFANYLYLVRRFTEAKKYYELAIKSSLDKISHPPKGSFIDDRNLNGELYSSLRRVLSLYTKIAIKPEEGMNFLKKYRQDKGITKFTREDIDKWIKGLKKWEKFDINSVKKIDEFIATNLKQLEDNKDKVNTGEHDITLLISSGVLTKFLNDNPNTDLVPTILYWLAISEKRLSNSYFFSLSDLYLKECILQYPKSAIAKSCYQEYEDNLTFGYSGSSGTDIPSSEKRELERLKNALK
jgi:hypothetical protein